MTRKKIAAPIPLPTIGQQIRAAREEAGHTQRSAAALVGVDQNTWARWEGDRRTPDLSTLRRVAECLGGSLIIALVDPNQAMAIQQVLDSPSKRA